MSKKNENGALDSAASNPVIKDNKMKNSIIADKQQGKQHDPFDPENLKIKTDFASTIGVQKVITTIPVRKPDRQQFVRVHPDPAYRLETAVIELKEERETYLINQAICPEMPLEVIPKILYTAINRQGSLFLWPIRLPGEDGKLDNWNHSALLAAELAQKNWIRCAANLSAGHYDVFKASADIAEPEWPELKFQEILKIAFQDRYIETIDHPVVQKLQGRI